MMGHNSEKINIAAAASSEPSGQLKDPIYQNPSEGSGRSKALT
jgi:hypothetical protein